jgi:hypothetical protein
MYQRFGVSDAAQQIIEMGAGGGTGKLLSDPKVQVAQRHTGDALSAGDGSRTFLPGQHPRSGA